VKKKFGITSKDKEDWKSFTQNLRNINPKEVDVVKQVLNIKKIPKLDLHGFTLDQANKEVEKFIIQSFNAGHKKLLIVTGKGLRSKSHDNPYASEKLSVLKYSVPEYIRNSKNLSNKINKISEANLKDGGEGAIYIFFKNEKKIKE
tara:strand:+ start:81 stop:518 length:438 start_codon:yes stop_codon:yes gene_type:complete